MWQILYLFIFQFYLCYILPLYFSFASFIWYQQSDIHNIFGDIVLEPFLVLLTTLFREVFFFHEYSHLVCFKVMHLKF